MQPERHRERQSSTELQLLHRWTGWRRDEDEEWGKKEETDSSSNSGCIGRAKAGVVLVVLAVVVEVEAVEIVVVEVVEVVLVLVLALVPVVDQVIVFVSECIRVSLSFSPPRDWEISF